MANLVYNKGLEEIAKALTDLDGSTLKVMLVDATYAANKDHLFVDDGTANDPQSHEISVAGYARQTLANKVVTRDDTNDMAYLDGDDVVFSALATGQTIGGAVLLRDAGGADTANPLIAFYDLTDTPTNGGSATVQWNTPANGAVLKLVSP
jgi:hypothetical protein